MIAKKIKKILLIFIFTIVLFGINNIDVYAASTTCTYSVLNGQYKLTYTITPDGREGADITNTNIEKITGTGTLKFADGGDMVTSSNFVSTSNKTIGCPSVLYYEVGYNQAGKYTYLKTSATSFNKSLGTISLIDSTNNGQSIAAKKEENPNAVTLLRTCRVTGKSTTSGGGKADATVKVYSDGILKVESTDSRYKVNTSSDVTFNMFKDKCPTDKVVLMCGGSGSNNFCNLTTEDNVINQKSTPTKEENDLDKVEEQNGANKNNDVEENGQTNSDSDRIDCEGLLGPDVRDDISEILGWIKIAVPILLVVLGSLDFSKAVLADDQNALSKAWKTFIKRIIAAIAVFFAPYLIMYLIEHVDKILDNSCDIRDLYKGVIMWKI